MQENSIKTKKFLELRGLQVLQRTKQEFGYPSRKVNQIYGGSEQFNQCQGSLQHRNNPISERENHPIGEHEQNVETQDLRD